MGANVRDIFAKSHPPTITLTRLEDVGIVDTDVEFRFDSLVGLCVGRQRISPWLHRVRSIDIR